MSDREVILAEIRRLAETTGHTPRQVELEGEAGITKSQIFAHFSRWTDAVRAAALQPYKRPNPNPASSDAELLEDWGAAVRKYGKPLQ